MLCNLPFSILLERPSVSSQAGDVDYVYLLATLQRPQWRTIVISRGTVQSMLHVNCDMKMRWETDIINPIYEMGGGRLQWNTSGGDAAESIKSLVNPFTPLTADEEWSDDIELLRSVIKQQSQKIGSLAPRKSEIGNSLRSTNPARFPHRIMIQSFLMKAIEKGVVIERGDGAWKTLCLPSHANHPSSVPTLPMSLACPVPQKELSAKTLEKVEDRPFVIFLLKFHCPIGSTPPFNAVVQATTDWILYMFRNRSQANSALHESSFLYSGTIVDMREPVSFPAARALAKQKVRNVQFVQCSVCLAQVEESSTIRVDRFDFVCSVECKEWAKTDDIDKELGVKLVVETLEFLATYDDICSPMGLLRRSIASRHPKECNRSRKLSKLWILEAEKHHKVKIYKHPGTKQNYVTLPKNFHIKESHFQIKTVNTSDEEKFVYNLLFDEACGWIDRRKVNLMLSKNFDGMKSPGMRNQVFMNGRKKLSFFIVKGSRKHIVALNNKDALVVLEDTIPPETGSEVKAVGNHSVHCPQDSCDNDGSDDTSSSKNDSSSDEEEDLEAFLRLNKR